MRVLDASFVVEWLKGGERHEAVFDALTDPDAPPFFAPDLLDIEVVSAFRGLVLGGHVSEERARGAIALLAELPVERRPASVLVPRVWALRDNHSAYDAAYLALAEALGCPLLTCDERLAGGAALNVEVRCVGGGP